VSAVGSVLPEDEGRRVAAGIEEQNAGWMIVFGALTRQFVAFPLFAAGPGTCVATVDPHALACRMRVVEATALHRDVPTPVGKSQRQAHCPERAVAPVPCPPPAAVGLAWEWLSPWCLPAAVLLPPGWAFLTPVPLAVLACRGRDGDRVPLSWQAVMAVAAGLGCGSASLLFRAVAERAGQRLMPGEPSWLAVAAACGVLQWAVTSAVVLIAARGARPPAAWVPAGRDAMRADVAGLCLGGLVAACVARCPCCALLAIPMIAVLRRSREHPGLARAARTDAKTGLLNAAAWQQAAGTEAARAARTGRPLAVAMIDIDHFKAVNDTRGHLAGDKVLAAVAGVIAEGVRGYDVAGRFGGEEFAVLLPDTGEAGAARMAERLRVRIAGTAVGFGGGELRVTVSIGIAVSRPGCATAEELVAAADAALYAAKRDGRDRVRLAELPSETDAGSCLEGASVHDHG
jgi:diguanylate cyclase (GGDEF)-like protein